MCPIISDLSAGCAFFAGLNQQGGLHPQRPGRSAGGLAVAACKVHPNLGLSCARILARYQACPAENFLNKFPASRPTTDPDSESSLLIGWPVGNFGGNLKQIYHVTSFIFCKDSREAGLG